MSVLVVRLFLVRHQGGGAFVFSGYKGHVWFAGFQIHWFPSEFHESRMNFTRPCTENSNVWLVSRGGSRCFFL